MTHTPHAPTPFDFMAMTDGPDFDLSPPPRGALHKQVAAAVEVLLGWLLRVERLIEQPKIERAANEAQRQRIDDLGAELTELSDLLDGK